LRRRVIFRSTAIRGRPARGENLLRRRLLCVQGGDVWGCGGLPWRLQKLRIWRVVVRWEIVVIGIVIRVVTGIVVVVIIVVVIVVVVAI